MIDKIKIEVAYDEEQCKELFIPNTFDIVFMDFVLPNDVRGSQLVKFMEEQEQLFVNQNPYVYFKRSIKISFSSLPIE